MKGLTKAGLRVALLGFAVVCLACEFPGRMTGGGSVFPWGGRGIEVQITVDAVGTRVTHGFEIHCGDAFAVPGPNNLEINWPGNKFHLEELTSAVCIDTRINPKPPAAGFDTFIGTGNGKLNGEEGALIQFIFTDAGEPRTRDTEAIFILPSPGSPPALAFGPTYLTFGNHQAHKENNSR